MCIDRHPHKQVPILRFWLGLWQKVKESESYSVGSDSLWPHGILQAKIRQWVAIPFCRGSSQPRDWTQVSCIAGRFFTREYQGQKFPTRKRQKLTCLSFFRASSHFPPRTLGLFFFFFFAMPWGMRDLSSPTKHQTHDPCSGSPES